MKNKVITTVLWLIAQASYIAFALKIIITKEVDPSILTCGFSAHLLMNSSMWVED